MTEVRVRDRCGSCLGEKRENCPSCGGSGWVEHWKNADEFVAETLAMGAVSAMVKLSSD